jgi:hypothetical protein
MTDIMLSGYDLEKLQVWGSWQMNGLTATLEMGLH